jgi:transposase
MDTITTLWMKDPNSESDFLTNVEELVSEAVFGQMARTVDCCSILWKHGEEILIGKDALLVIFQQECLISVQEEQLWKWCTHDVVVLMSISVLSSCATRRIEQGQRHKELRQFSTMTNEILELKEWLKASKCTHVAMESTGVYWKPIYHLLQDSFEIVPFCAQHMKNVPGRKTDVKDAEWIADLLQHGLLKASFIPSSEQQAVRDLTRTRMRLLQERTRLINRIHKVLEEANLKLASVVSDIMGITGQAILRALLAGEVDPESLSHLARGSLVRKEDQLQAALQGNLSAHQHMQLEELLQLIAALDHSIARFDREIAERLRWLDPLIERIDAVTGLARRSIEVLLGELGWDMNHFPDAAHAASWIGICPGKHETAGKQKSGRARKGNSFRQIGARSGRPCRRAYPDLPGRTISSDSCATRGQESGHGRRSQHSGDFLSDGQDR